MIFKKSLAFCAVKAYNKEKMIISWKSMRKIRFEVRFHLIPHQKSPKFTQPHFFVRRERNKYEN